MKYIIVLTTLWSCELVSAKTHSPWQYLNENMKAECESKKIENMPRVRSQDSLPICGAMSSATIAQHYLCKKSGISNCSAVSGKDEISPFSTLAWAHTNKGYGVHETFNHENIKVYADQGGGAVDILSNAEKDSMFMSDSCFPLDQFSVAIRKRIEAKEASGKNRLDAANEAASDVKEIFYTIQKQFEIYQSKKNKQKTEADFCEACLVGAVQSLGFERTIEDLKNKMDKSSNSNAYQFLYNTTLGQCDDFVELNPKPKFESFPTKFKEAKRAAQKNKDKRIPGFNYQDLVEKVKSVLNSGNPLAFDGICLEFKGDKCSTGHSVVISGYRKVCKDKCGTDCKDVLRIQNSWGQDWQKANNDGWVDASALFSYVSEDPERMENSLSWYH